MVVGLGSSVLLLCVDGETELPFKGLHDGTNLQDVTREIKLYFFHYYCKRRN